MLEFYCISSDKEHDKYKNWSGHCYLKANNSTVPRYSRLQTKTLELVYTQQFIVCKKKEWVIIPHDLILRYFYCRREVANKEEELEDVRTAAQKKVKALEQQLENEHEERINFVREKHELETRIINLQEMASRSADEEQVSKLKRDLKRTKALLKDAQLMVEKSRNESSNKVVLRQLKNQVRTSK